MISDTYLDDEVIEAFKDCFQFLYTSVHVDLNEFYGECSWNGQNARDIMDETLEELYPQYNAMNSIQRDEVIDELLETGQCDLDSIYERFPNAE